MPSRQNVDARCAKYHAAHPDVYEKLQQDLRKAIPDLEGRLINFSRFLASLGVQGDMKTFYFRKIHAEQPDIALCLRPLRRVRPAVKPLFTSLRCDDPLRPWEVAAESTTCRRLDVILANRAEDASAVRDSDWFMHAREILAMAQDELDVMQAILDDPEYRRKIAKND